MGWKAFWSEIVIVVLGVAIALAANQAVEDWSWRNKVQDGEARLRSDVDWAFFWMAEHYATNPCVQAQLVSLTTHLMQRGADFAPVPVHSDVSTSRFVVRIPYRPYRFSVWDALVANGTATHLPLQRHDSYGYVASEMARMRMRTEQANQLTGQLMILSHPIELDAGVREDLLANVEDLRQRYAADAFSAQQRLRRIVESLGTPSAQAVTAFLDESGTIRFCKQRGLPLADWRDVYKPTASP